MIQRPTLNRVQCGCGVRVVAERYLDAIRAGWVVCGSCGERPRVIVVAPKRVIDQGHVFEVVWDGATA